MIDSRRETRGSSGKGSGLNNRLCSVILFLENQYNSAQTGLAD
jgi:hypothetical protein